ncbi:DUF7338 family protein [Polynucleobacter paneuropaeus]|uniref:DUF7338 family protein n=1 Tax=Polynucleobacter paneuropaeus TaxID=2527775 RepID=UPI001BFDBCA4|nr:hypothetical protein [Polynucleobacter paneuropaeus]QWD55291.1 hypothetical protein C2750_06025 [Polynucleobacter paneuropaeus]
MIYFIYAVLVPLNLAMTLIAIPLSLVLPRFATQSVGWCDNHGFWGIGPRLPNWLSWFQTPDNSLDGDHSFIAINSYGYWAQVKWLIRNPAYAFAMRYINTIENKPVLYGNDSIKDNDNSVAGWCFVKCAGLFQFTWVQPIGFSRCIYCVFGWNIRGTLHKDPSDSYQATFDFSPRISGYR